MTAERSTYSAQIIVKDNHGVIITESYDFGKRLEPPIITKFGH